MFLLMVTGLNILSYLMILFFLAYLAHFCQNETFRSQEEVAEARGKWGHNKISIPSPNFWTLYVEQTLSPFFVFQVFSFFSLPHSIFFFFLIFIFLHFLKKRCFVSHYGAWMTIGITLYLLCSCC